jgi:hypothetical protein
VSSGGVSTMNLGVSTMNYFVLRAPPGICAMLPPHETAGAVQSRPRLLETRSCLCRRQVLRQNSQFSSSQVVAVVIQPLPGSTIAWYRSDGRRRARNLVPACGHRMLYPRPCDRRSRAIKSKAGTNHGEGGGASDQPQPRAKGPLCSGPQSTQVSTSFFTHSKSLTASPLACVCLIDDKAPPPPPPPPPPSLIVTERASRVTPSFGRHLGLSSPATHHWPLSAHVRVFLIANKAPPPPSHRACGLRRQEEEERRILEFNTKLHVIHLERLR